MSTIQSLKSQAKRLRAHLLTQNITFTHSQCLEAVAAQQGYRDWNTAVAALNQTATAEPTVEAPLLLCVDPDMEPEQLRDEVQKLLRREPRAIRFRVDSGVTFELARFARSVASDVEEMGIVVEFDMPL